MKDNLLTKKLLPLFISLMMALFIITGCEPTDPPSGGTGPAGAGANSECTYSDGLSDSGYGSAQVFYPCETAEGPFAATTLTGGFTNTKEDMYWLASHLLTHGYIVIAITPTNTLGSAPTWETAHKAGIEMLISENSRQNSPIYGLVDTNNLQISGYSMGGGGALLAAHDLGLGIASVQAFAPYGGGTTLGGISVPTICYAGGSDGTASPSSVIDQFDSLPDNIERTYAEFSGVAHLAWVSGSDEEKIKFMTYITSWMKVYLDGDESYSEYIDGNQDWFNDFVINSDVGGGSGGCN